MRLDNNQRAFFSLLRAGLWEQNVRLLQFGSIDYPALYKLAEEQSVVGLVAAGLEHVVDTKVPKEETLNFVGSALQLEQRNTAMNHFIGVLIEKMRAKDIYALLVKGQGIAQCYERPLWRACGDVDLLLSNDNYNKTKSFLIPFSSRVDEEDLVRKHMGMTIDSWVVELHGSLDCGVSKHAAAGVEDVKKCLFEGGEVRSWMNGKTHIFLPNADNDVIIVFTHILQHFFYGGIGLRQVCDWCRLLWTYKDSIDRKRLEKRLRSMRIISEWKALAALAVNYLGMPVEAMPLYDSSKRWKNKANRILSMIIETGNFGHNRDESYYQKHSFLVYKAISFFRNTWDSMRHFMIFPVDAMNVWWRRLGEGICAAVKGK